VRSVDDTEALRLLHELQVHQLELELQNEELRSTRSALETSLRRYTELFDFAPLGYIAVGDGGLIREANFAAASLLGVLRAKLPGRRLATFLSQRDRAAFDRFLTAIFTADDDAPPHEPLELSLLTMTGDRIVRVTGALLDEPAEPTALIAAEDVTARRTAEDALHEALRRRDDFLGTLSHELRNPLSPIRNGLYLLQRAIPGGDGARRAIAVIDRQVSHLTRIVDDLLDVTRIARGKLELKRRVLDIGEIVRRTLDDHRPAFESAGVTLDARLAADCLANVDATRLAQILGNLLGNAVKFTPRGGHVMVVLEPEGDRLALRVRDTGAGISPDLLARLFQPFSQGPQALARTAGGLGLGLATVRGLVELHGGSVIIESAGPGKGTEVRVTLPRAAATALAAAPPRPARSAHHRVLVIDDNEDAATSLKDVLETRGHEVRTARDAPGALEVAHAFLPEIVVCDIGLPGADGYSVARYFRGDRDLSGAYLIALSGYARPDDVQRSLDAGFDRHLAKPASVEGLEAMFAHASGASSGIPSARLPR
jgi:PAS domain S-box-containing protein